MNLILVSCWFGSSLTSLTVAELLWNYNYMSEIKNQVSYFLIVQTSTEDYFEVSLKLSDLQQQLKETEKKKTRKKKKTTKASFQSEMVPMIFLFFLGWCFYCINC